MNPKYARQTKRSVSNQDHVSHPLFSFSTNRSALTFLFLLILELWGDLGYAIPTRDIGGAVFLSLLAAGCAYGLITEAFTGIRTAYFYDDRVRISIFRLRKEIDYSLIEKVTKAKVLPILSGPDVNIYLKGVTRPLVIRGNPTNSKMKTDLYTWLNSRIGGSATT